MYSFEINHRDQSEIVLVDDVTSVLARFLSVNQAIEQLDPLQDLVSCNAAEGAEVQNEFSIQTDAADRCLETVAATVVDSPDALRLGLLEVASFCPTFERDGQIIDLLPGVNASLTRAIRYSRMRREVAMRVMQHLPIRGQEQVSTLEALHAYGANQIFSSLEIVRKRVPHSAVKAAVGIITPDEVIGRGSRLERDRRFRDEIRERLGEEFILRIIGSAVDYSDVAGLVENSKAKLKNLFGI